MNRHHVVINDEHDTKLRGSIFRWHFNAADTVGSRAVFFESEYPPTGERSWVISGSIGRPEEQNIFGFILSVPKTDEDILERTYTLGDEQGFSMSHYHSLPSPPGSTSQVYVAATSGELTIRLSIKDRRIEGDFRATFNKEGYRMAPAGTFKGRIHLLEDN